MSRLGIKTLLALAGASLTVACSVMSAAAAMDNCGQTYRSCNVSCNQSPDASNALGVCKKRCDLQLIACDTQSADPVSRARGASAGRLPSNDD
jgi:hypothetical protein